MKRTDTLCGQNVAILYVKMGGTYSYHNVSQYTSTVQQSDAGCTTSLPTAQTLTWVVRKAGFISSVLRLSATVVRKPGFISSVPRLSASAIFHTTSPLTTVKVRPLSSFSYLAEW